MSSAGKDVLIKAVAQAIPTYAMSCFDLTKSLCDDIGRMVCRFWWAQQENENKMHWISWEWLCSRKKKGGMGYRDLHLFNLAMLARQGWRLIVELDSLCAQVLRAKYYPNGDLLGVKEKSGISYSWRSLIRGLKALNNGLIWRVGDGTNINIWTDPWIPNKSTRRLITPRGRTVLTKVSDLISPITEAWDEELICEVFWPEDAQNILFIPIKSGYDDMVVWHFDPRGIFSTKSAYHVLEDKREQSEVKQVGSSSAPGNEEANNLWGKIWKLDCIPKIKQFFWHFAHNSLPLRMNIVRRGLDIDTRCLVCSRLDEDGGHCFLKCKFVKKCWQGLNLEDVRTQLLNLHSARDVVESILGLN